VLKLQYGKPALNMDEYIEALKTFAARKSPSVFSFKAKLPTEGRADLPLAATDCLSIILKAYASGGENALHAHVHEDHSFIVLQGTATFFGEGNQKLAELEKFQGILIPKGALYRFEAGKQDQLVMLRVGNVNIFPDPIAAYARVGSDGKDMDGYSEENHEVPLVYGQEKWFPSS